MNRRQLLRRGLVLGAAGLAGCQTGSDDTTTGSPTGTTRPDGTTATPLDTTTTGTPTPTGTPTATATATVEPTPTATPEPPTIPPTLDRTFEPEADIGSFSDVVILDSGDYVFAGSTGSADESSFGWLVRVDPAGTQQWAESYGSGPTRFTAVDQTSDGSLVVVGRTQTDGETLTGYVQSVATDGTAQWSTALDRDAGNTLNGVLGTPNGIVAAGAAAFGDDGSASALAVELDDSGTVVSDSLDDEEYIRSYNQVVDAGDGQYALIGVTSPARGSADGYLSVVDAQFESQFSQRYDERSFEAFRDGIRLEDGGFLLVGDSSPQRAFGNANEDMWLVRTDSEGSPAWSTTHDMENGDRVTDVVQESDGTFFCVGRTDMTTEGTNTGFAARVSSDGTVTETSTYGDDDELGSSANDDPLTCLALAGDGTLVAGGLKNLGETDGTLTGLGWMLTF